MPDYKNSYILYETSAIWYLQFDVPSAVLMKSVFLWDIIPSSPLEAENRPRGHSLFSACFTRVSCLIYY
jgi:hypothetical protein